MKVVCIDNSRGSPGLWKGDIPKIGCVYTVIDHEEAFIKGQTIPCYVLKEIKNWHSWTKDGSYAIGYRTARFRPLDERKTDITELKKLTQMREDVLA